MLCKHCLFSFFSFTPTNFSICHSQVSITNVFTLRAENQVTLSWTAHTAYSLLISTITKHTSPFGLAPGAGLYPCSLQAPREEKKKIRSVPISNTEGGSHSHCFLLLWGSVCQGQASWVQKLTVTHASPPSHWPSCEAREVWSRSDPLSSSTEPLGDTLSSWLTTSWFRLSGSDSHVTNRPKPGGNTAAAQSYKCCSS